MNNKNYTSLEPSYADALGISAPTFSTGEAVSLLASTSFLYSLGIMVSVVAAGIMYMRAGAIRMQASERAVSKSNEEIKRVTLGLLGVLSLFVIIYTFNRDLLTGTVGFESLKTQGYSSGGGGNFGGGGATGNTGGATCADPKSVSGALSSSGGLCGGAQCTALVGCKYQQYLPIIEMEAAKHSLDKNLVIAVMCQESRGDAKANRINKNNGGKSTYDCGLMQINQQSECSSQVLDPQYNIAEGVTRLKRAQNAASQAYPNIPGDASTYASYNCCANGTIPNSPSADCTQASGFPYTIPKWACPINPWTSESNMCTVKSTSCGIAACVKQLSGM